MNHCLTVHRRTRRQQKCKSGIFHIQILSFITYFRSGYMNSEQFPLKAWVPKPLFASNEVTFTWQEFAQCQGTHRVYWSWPASLGLPWPHQPCSHRLYLSSAWGTLGDVVVVVVFSFVLCSAWAPAIFLHLALDLTVFFDPWMFGPVLTNLAQVLWVSRGGGWGVIFTFGSYSSFWSILCYCSTTTSTWK